LPSLIKQLAQPLQRLKGDHGVGLVAQCLADLLVEHPGWQDTDRVIPQPDQNLGQTKSVATTDDRDFLAVERMMAIIDLVPPKNVSSVKLVPPVAASRIFLPPWVAS
jgi:hypothetical protein